MNLLKHDELIKILLKIYIFFSHVFATICIRIYKEMLINTFFSYFEGRNVTKRMNMNSETCLICVGSTFDRWTWMYDWRLEVVCSKRFFLQIGKSCMRKSSGYLIWGNRVVSVVTPYTNKVFFLSEYFDWIIFFWATNFLSEYIYLIKACTVHTPWKIC